MGVHFPLADFEQRIMTDPDVLGMLYCGSRGRGQADRYSDLDITIWLTDEAHAKPGRIEHYLRWLGEIQFLHVSHNEFAPSCDSYIGPNWHKAELELIGSNHPEPHPYFHGVTVVKDTDGRLASLVAASPPPTTELTREAARAVIEKLLYEVGSITMGTMRGSYFHQMHNLSEYANSGYTLLAQLRGHEGYAVRFMERFLNEEELALLYAAWPQAPEREAIRRAARGLLEWLRYVWVQVEQTLGEELGISLDTVAFQQALDRLYDWDLTEHLRTELLSARLPPNPPMQPTASRARS
jgi:hypothetical protein